MSIREPNLEQKKAIEHNGGVLLAAGAGSGKTFVLVEHIIYLLKGLKNKINSSENKEQDIKKYLNSVVMMTFTKKAAGEMGTRLYKRLIEEGELGDDKEFWDLVGKNLNSLYVGTIHGFCYKLISKNFFPELKANFDIIDADSQKSKIQDLFDEWFQEGKKERQDFMNEVLLLNRKQVLGSVFEIFSNPDLRNFWDETTLESLVQTDIISTVEEILDNEPWGYVINGSFNLGSFQESESKAWFKNIQGFLNVVKSIDWSKENSWVDLDNFFSSVSRWTKTSKTDKSEEVDQFIDDIKEFKNFLSNDGKAIQAFLKNRDVYASWIGEFFSLFNFISSRYDKLGGLTFSDLEYYVLKGVKGSRETIDKLCSQYKYYIVDEFQDTSEVQFEILESLIDKRYERLFCVGDLKQAIYGFRGGDLGVFKRCQSLMPQSLFLSKNYRSEAKIIDLNNTLFDFLFKVGVSFKGVEKNPVVVDYQEYPGSDQESGDVRRLIVEVSSEETITSKDMDLLEAEELHKSILSTANAGETVGILYKNLGASSHLIQKLVESDLSFTAQVKIPMSEGPLWALFYTLLESYLDRARDKKTNQISFLIQGILNWLGLSIETEKVSSLSDKFFKNIGVMGVQSSFEVFMSDFGICDADNGKNFSNISHLIELAGEDPEKLFNLLKEFGPERISVEFRYGETPENIFLMTAHGSKGLEFDHVFLGGIHTNGRKNSSSPLLGKRPGSIKWKLSADQKDYFKSPIYLLEEKISTKKDFAESKRLFYVACTRAQKTLTYADLNTDVKPIKYSDDSWINGFRLYEQSNDFIEKKVSNFSTNVAYEGRSISDEVRGPLFQRDNLGLFLKKEKQNSLGLISEISVTRLATLAQCPRKFYLSNICKIDEDDLERTGYGSEFLISDQKHIKEEIEYEKPKPNTRERGIEVHDALSRAVLGNLVCPLDVSDKNQPAVNFGIDLLKKKGSYELITEVPVKFSLFGQMISGTPDLILLPEEKTKAPEIWDFKTGTQKENSELAYWFQLYCYGIQTCDEQGLSDSDEIILALVYVDEKKIVEQKLSKKDLKEKLFMEWKKLANFNQVNLDHCSTCSFGNLCQNLT
ncbi:MAG: superfamily I DNA/RNA helicase [Bacteriovoracaceae bacterium]